MHRRKLCINHGAESRCQYHDNFCNHDSSADNQPSNFYNYASCFSAHVPSCWIFPSAGKCSKRKCNNNHLFEYWMYNYEMCRRNVFINHCAQCCLNRVINVTKLNFLSKILELRFYFFVHLKNTDDNGWINKAAWYTFITSLRTVNRFELILEEFLVSRLLFHCGRKMVAALVMQCHWMFKGFFKK